MTDTITSRCNMIDIHLVIQRVWDKIEGSDKETSMDYSEIEEETNYAIEVSIKEATAQVIKDVQEKILDRIDHWTLYRPLTESKEAIEVRKELMKILEWLEQYAKDKGVKK